jgi:tetratricopeptide (TPR) repeat protein
MSRRWWLLGLLATVPALALPQAKPQQEEQAPPEEDENLIKPEYTFNPLQAEKELKIGNFYMKKGKYKAAAIRYEEATRWDPNSAEAFLKLGEAMEKQKDAKAASAAYEKYLELAPDAKNAQEIKRKISTPKNHPR